MPTFTLVELDRLVAFFTFLRGLKSDPIIVVDSASFTDGRKPEVRFA